MSPYAFYQLWIQAEDAKVGEYLKQFTFLPVDEIDALMAEHLEAPGRRVAQRRLAAEVTTLVHGTAEVEAAELASGALFGRGDLADAPGDDARRRPPRGRRRRPARDADAPTLVDALVATQLVDSRSAARRAVADGGAYVNNERVDDPDLDLAGADLLHGSWVVLRRGKRSVSGVRLT